MYKPGYRTSEFWFTLVSFIFSGLFLLGIIQQEDTKDELIEVVSHALESIILIGGQILIFYRYIQSRDKYNNKYSKEKQEEYNEIGRELENYIGVDKSYENININNATIGELIQLPHIGPALAKKIVKYRNTHGNFVKPENIMLVNGIAQNTYEDIKEYIIV
jgi:competence ComEA-like helix-hairpin-helix protein